MPRRSTGGSVDRAGIGFCLFAKTEVGGFEPMGLQEKRKEDRSVDVRCVLRMIEIDEY